MLSFSCFQLSFFSSFAYSWNIFLLKSIRVLTPGWVVSHVILPVNIFLRDLVPLAFVNIVYCLMAFLKFTAENTIHQCSLNCFWVGIIAWKNIFRFLYFFIQGSFVKFFHLFICQRLFAISYIIKGGIGYIFFKGFTRTRLIQVKANTNSFLWVFTICISVNMFFWILKFFYYFCRCFSYIEKTYKMYALYSYASVVN